MSDSSRSFWSSVPGLVTGLAGLLTAIVGLLSISFQQGWIGGKSGGDTPTTLAPGQAPSTVAGQGGSAGGTVTTTVLGTFEVQPSPIEFKAGGSREITVTVRNTGSTPINVPTPAVTDTTAFSVADVSCTARPVERGGTCQVKVTFRPSGVLRTYSASLAVTPRDARSVNVPITATSVL